MFVTFRTPKKVTTFLQKVRTQRAKDIQEKDQQKWTPAIFYVFTLVGCGEKRSKSHPNNHQQSTNPPLRYPPNRELNEAPTKRAKLVGATNLLRRVLFLASRAPSPNRLPYPPAWCCCWLYSWSSFSFAFGFHPPKKSATNNTKTKTRYTLTTTMQKLSGASFFKPLEAVAFLGGGGFLGRPAAKMWKFRPKKLVFLKHLASPQGVLRFLLRFCWTMTCSKKMLVKLFLGRSRGLGMIQVSSFQTWSSTLGDVKSNHFV